MTHKPDTGHLRIKTTQVYDPRVASSLLGQNRRASFYSPNLPAMKKPCDAVPRPSFRSPRGFIALEIVVALSVLFLIIFSGLLFTLHAYGRVSGRTAVEDELRSLVLDSRLDNLPSHPDRQQAIAEAKGAIAKRLLVVAPKTQIKSIDVRVPEPDATTSVMMALRRAPIEVTVHASQCIGPCSPATRYEYTVRASGYREISSESSNIVPTDCNGYPISDRQRYKKFPCPCSDPRRHSDPISGLCVCLPHLVVDADGGCQCPSPFQSFNVSAQVCDCDVGELTAYCAGLGLLINGTCGCGDPCPTGSIIENNRCQCPDGTQLQNNACVPCPPGTAGTDGVCHACPAGTFATGLGNTVCQSCSNNSVSTSSGASSCTACPPDSLANGSLTQCVCGSGRQMNATNDSCTLCPPGTAGTDGTCTSCSPGTHSSAAGNASCLSCPDGSIATQSGAQSCQACPSGGSSNTSRTACACPDGSGLSADGGSCVACPEGTSGTGGTCSPCPAGTFASGTGNTAGSTSCTQCSTTSIQPSQGQTSCTDCPANASANKSRTACTCNNGYKSDGPSSCVQCSPGTAGTSGSCSSCSKGRFAATSGKTSCDLCPSGKYQNSTGATSCLDCPNNSTSWDNREGCTCNAGYYMDGSSCKQCPQGSAGTSGSCSPCAAGKFSGSNGASTCSDCPTGTVQASSGQSSCETCPPNSSPNASRTKCVCNAGYTLDSKGVCQQCSEGHYGSDGLCYSCPAGTYQDSKGQTSCKACSSTDYQPSTGKTSCLQCPANSTASADRTACNCNSGYTMNAITGLCEVCPQGTRGQNGSCIACTAGTYASGTGNTSCATCPDGTTSGSGASACAPCQNGQVANPEKTACVCAAGSTMVNGSCQGCPAGTQWVNGSCSSCPAGTYSASTGSTSCTNCPQGQVSLTAGSASCQSCGPNATAGADRASCDCNNGYTKNGSVCELCPAGTYGNGSGGCLACNAGSISSPDRLSCVGCTGNTVRTSGDTCGECPAPTLANQQHSACITCGADEIYVGGLCVECPGALVPIDGACKCPESAITAGAAQSTYGFSFDTQSCSVTCAGVIRTKDGVKYCLDPVKCGEYISPDGTITEVTCASGFIFDPSSGVCTCLE